jgi:hypothetical protein
LTFTTFSHIHIDSFSLRNRLLVHEPEKRLGANGAAEVKSHPFFQGVDWENLALQKAAFVPQPESINDTSYFVSRFSESSCSDTETGNNSGSNPDSGDEVGIWKLHPFLSRYSICNHRIYRKLFFLLLCVF